LSQRSGTPNRDDGEKVLATVLVSGDVVGRRGLFATNDDDALGRRIAMMHAKENTDFIIYWILNRLRSLLPSTYDKPRLSAMVEQESLRLRKKLPQSRVSVDVA
jgi:hypothetical protein